MPAKFPSTSALAAEQGKYPYRDSVIRPVLKPEVSAEQLITAFLTAPPGWVDSLMVARDRIVSRYGLKTSGKRHGLPQGPFRVGQQLGVFRILHLSPSEAILGEDDRHLDFRVSLLADAGQLRVSTLVRPHNLFGWLYLATVLPFHHLISSVVTKRMAQIINDSNTP